MRKNQFRGGFTLVELLVVIAIIGTLVGLLLPAVQAARESGRKATCANNVKQMALGALNYEAANRYYPTSGEGKRWNGSKWVDAFNVMSFQVSVLPFIEQAGLAAKWDKTKAYTYSSGSSVVGSNSGLAATRIATFLCPSNSVNKPEFGGTSTGAAAIIAAGGAAAVGQSTQYGTNDYMPIVYTDLSPSDGQRLSSSTPESSGYKLGLLRYDASATAGSCFDGTSNTALFLEDSGRTQQDAGKYSFASDWYIGEAGAVVLASGSFYGSDYGPASYNATATCPNRWADPDNGSGVSGPPDEETTVPRTKSIINNTPQVTGDSTCPWTKNNCGPNDEPFSLHAGNGIYSGFADGSVHWLSAALNVHVLRQLSDPSDREPVKKFE